MHHDQRYGHALSAALVILNEIDQQPDMPKHKRLGLATYSILHVMDRWEKQGKNAMPASRSTDRRTHQLAMRLARQCRRIVQACLREEEWGDADREFYEIIRQGLQQQRSGGNACTSGTS